ncbi:hypothetical protein B0H13DRAFT_2318958 [Mycena leptocephala]|nr:hypothetical protein B0H13DRAFT_2318958 [Mycena leptocephala]
MPPSSDNNATPGPSSGQRGSAASGAKTGEKRGADDRDSPLGDDSEATTKKARRAGVRAKKNQYGLAKVQIPPQFKGTKDSGYLHGYILWGITRSDTAPMRPSTSFMAAYERRREPGFLATLKQTLRSATTAHVGAAKMVKLLRTQAEEDRNNGSIIAGNILRVEEAFLLKIFSGVLTAGLESWCPDVLSPPDTLYNQTHEIVFTQTLRSVGNSFAYRFLEPTPSGFDNPSLLIDIFNSFVFNYMRDKTRVDMKDPGKLSQNRDDNNASRRRKALAKVRLQYALDDKQPARVLALLRDPLGHSDDESGTEADGKLCYIVNKKPPRSVSATIFLRNVDKRRQKLKKTTKGRKEERKRIHVNVPDESDISFQIPKSAPIDWLAPDWYNDLPAKLRYRYSRNGVALPLVQHHDNTDYKTMDKATFMQKYGNDVLKLYNVPTKEEMDGAGNNGYDEDEEEDVGNMMDEDD